MNKFLFEPPKFLDPQRTLFAAGLTSGQVLADLGAGSGFYVIAAAKIVGPQGTVYAVDILETALDHIAAEARLNGLHNIKTIHCDLENANSCTAIPAGSLDYVLLGNIAHQLKKQAEIFKEAYRLLKTGGKLIVLEWNDQPSPIGPSVHERLMPNAVSKFASKVSFKDAGPLPTDMYHYGLMFIK
ncbi:MAG TPA: class I SAM-dependent methyltransferase [Methylomirabilota bacterium]|nr:class I SAM-dependent methyltransferase [Methylomirabilota bacterium]